MKLNHCGYCGRLVRKDEKLCDEHKIDTPFDYSNDGREEERREAQAQKDAEQWRP